jgi:hypothetical protein
MEPGEKKRRAHQQAEDERQRGAEGDVARDRELALREVARYAVRAPVDCVTRSVGNI